MRIAVFIKATTFHSSFGGLETQNKVLCEGLVNRGHEVIVFSPQRDVNKVEIKENGVLYKFVPSVYKLGFFSSNNKNNWVNKSFVEFEKFHKKKKVDLVVSQSSAGVGIIRRKNEIDMHVVSIAHGTILGELRTKLKGLTRPVDFIRLPLDIIFVLRVFFGRQREFIHNANKVIAVSSVVKRALLEETFVPSEKVVVIYNAVNEKKFEALSKKRKNKKNVVLIYVGRVVKSKGLGHLIEALACTELSNATLNVVGGGEDLDSIKKMVEDFGLSRRVHFCGKIPHDDVISKLFDSDVFVLPSLRVEGFPMTLVEAMFAGLPIVASNIGGISDAVEDAKTGFLVEPGNTSELREKLLKLTNKLELRRRFGDNGKEKAYNEFSLNIMLDKYEEIFKEVLQ